jgi:hypothetical protein
MRPGSNSDNVHNVRCSFFPSHASRQRRRITMIVSCARAFTSETTEPMAFATAQVRESVARATTEVQPTGREIEDERPPAADLAVANDRALKPPSMAAEVRPCPIDFDPLGNLFATALIQKYDRLTPMLIGGHCEGELSPNAPTISLAPLVRAAPSIVKCRRSDEVPDVERKGVVHGARKGARPSGHNDTPFGCSDRVPKLFAPSGREDPPKVGPALRVTGVTQIPGKSLSKRKLGKSPGILPRNGNA